MGTRDRRVAAVGVQRGCGTGRTAKHCLGLCLSAAATMMSTLEISRRGVAVSVGVQVEVAFDATVVHISLLRCATCFWSRVISSLSWYMILFLSSAWILLKDIIPEVHKVSIFRVIALSRVVSWLVTKGLIAFFRKSASIFCMIVESRWGFRNRSEKFRGRR